MAIVEKRGTNNNIGISVTVYIPRICHGISKLGVCQIVFPKPCKGIAQAGGRPVEHIRAALVGLAVDELVCAKDDIGKAVTVHVTGGGHAVAVLDVDHVAFGAPGRSIARNGGGSTGGGKTGGGAKIDVSTAFVGLAGVLFRRADHDVRIPVAVHVARTGHGEAHLCLGFVAFHRPCGGCGKSGRGTVVHVDPSLIGLDIVPEIRTDDDISVPVTRDVPRCGDRVAKIRVEHITFNRPGGVQGGAVCAQSGGGSMPHEDLALVLLAVVIQRCADDDITVGVAVHIARGGHGIAKTGVGLVTFRCPGRGGGGA